MKNKNYKNNKIVNYKNLIKLKKKNNTISMTLKYKTVPRI